MWLQQLVLRNEARWPDRPALRDPEQDVTWRELGRRVRGRAMAMAGRLRPGERLLIVSGNRVEMIEVYLACAWAGLIAVPVNPTLTDAELSAILDGVRPAMAVADDAGLARLRTLRPQLPAEHIAEFGTAAEGLTHGAPLRPLNAECITDPMLILHTSATTGRPKGVIYTQRTVALNAGTWLADVPVAPGTVFLNACPLYHATMVIALHYLAAGGTVCILDRFTPQGCLAAIERWGAEHAYLVPSMVRLVLEAKALQQTDLSSLRLLIHGAAPMSASLAEAARTKLGTELLTSYGATEAGGPVIALHPEDKPGTPPHPGATCVGRPQPGIGVEVRDVHGVRLAPGEIGEVHICGDGLMSGYWDNREATDEIMVDGWLNARDLGCVDDTGLLWLVDRRNDLIIRGGQNIYPAELETTLVNVPGVADIAVVAATSEVWGQVPVAYVRPDSSAGISPESLTSALLEACVGRLAPYKRPSSFVFVDEIPRSPSGKILRRILRQRFEEQNAAGSADADGAPDEGGAP